MELRQYIRIIVTNLWLIIPIALLAFTTSMFFSYNQIPIYESSSTYVTKLNSTFSSSDNIIFGIDTLTGRDRIFVTYCEVMQSEAVRTRAFELMNLDPLTVPKITDYSTKCTVLPTSNVLLLVTHGPSPDLIMALNKAIGLAGMEASNRLYAGTIEVTTLDPVRLEPQAISPSHSRSAILGLALGAIVGVTLAIMLDYLRSPLEKIEAQAIRDGLLNVYNDRYFQQRLAEEIRRSKSRQRPLSIALSKLVPTEDFELFPESVQEALKRQVAQFMQEKLSESDLLAYNRKTDLFQMVIPETSNTESRETMVQLHQEIQSRSFRSNEYIGNFRLETGIVESSGQNLELGRMLEKANKAVQKAQLSTDSSLIYLRDAPNPFFAEDGNDNEEYITVSIQLKNGEPISLTQEIEAILAKPAEDGTSGVGIAPSNDDLIANPETFDRLFGGKPLDNGKDKNEKYNPTTTE
jgi:diguanylate cyclase (GGDEF)-like protein